MSASSATTGEVCCAHRRVIHSIHQRACIMRFIRGRLARLIAVGCVALLIASCATVKPPAQGVGEAIDWKQIEGWAQDRHAQAWPALLRSCDALGAKARWRELCRAARAMSGASAASTIDDEHARRFFERWFTPHRVHGRDGRRDGLITGYYEPLLHGSFTRDARYRHPLYAPPATLLSVELGALHPALRSKTVRGRLDGNKIVPFYSRAQIDSDRSLLAGDELIWIDDRDAVFFLHIQGSGRVRLPDGRIIGVGYANQNGHPYHAIGRVLLARGELAREEVSLFTIRRWLRENPRRAEALLFRNPSYVFFTLRDNAAGGPIGSLNVALTPQRSLAVDPKLIELGAPVWLATHHPFNPAQPYRRLMLAQDTGGAIRGALRADLFWGHGAQAERAAGVMRQRGKRIVL
ncbi:MAG: murein transglycosylase A, partial [bacterium]